MIYYIRKYAVLCLLASAIAACATAPSPPLAYRPPAPGLVIVYSHVADAKGDPARANTRHEIVANEGDTVINRVISIPSYIVRENRTLRAVVTNRIYQPGGGIAIDGIQADNIRALWPLAPDKTARSTGPTFLGRGRTEKAAEARLRRTGTIDYDFKILRREKVTVPAGTFDTVVFHRLATVRDLSGAVTLVSDKTYWIALDLGWLVQLDTVNTRPGKPPTKARLAAIEVIRPGVK